MNLKIIKCYTTRNKLHTKYSVHVYNNMAVYQGMRTSISYNVAIFVCILSSLSLKRYSRMYFDSKGPTEHSYKVSCLLYFQLLLFIIEDLHVLSQWRAHIRNKIHRERGFGLVTVGFCNQTCNNVSIKKSKDCSNYRVIASHACKITLKMLQHRILLHYIYPGMPDIQVGF